MSGQDGKGERLLVVDVLRGFALMALFLVHMVECYELYWAHPVKTWVSEAVFLLFMGKSFSLLALCFGFSFFVLMDRAAQRGGDFSGRFAWRLLVLEAIGFLHALIYRGDIIQLLAALGLLLLLAHRVKSNRAILIMAVVCFLQPELWWQFAAAANGADWANQLSHYRQDPQMAVYLHGNFAALLRANLLEGQYAKWWFLLESGRAVQIVGLYLVGMVLGRTGFFARLDEFARFRHRAMAIAIAFALLCHLALLPATELVGRWGAGGNASQILGVIVESWFELASTAVWALAICALWQSRGRALLAPLAPVGRATLTLYIGQSLVFVPLLYPFGLGLYDDWSAPLRLSIGLMGIAAQLWLARLWFDHFQYGPIEWAWRSLTYLRRDVPFRRERGRARVAPN